MTNSYEEARAARYAAQVAAIATQNEEFVNTVIQLLRDEGLELVSRNKDGKDTVPDTYGCGLSGSFSVTVEGQEIWLRISAEASYENSGAWTSRRTLNNKSSCRVELDFDKVYGSVAKDTVKAATKAAAGLADAIRFRAARKNREVAAEKARQGLGPAVVQLRKEFELTYEFTHCSVKGKKPQAKAEATPNGVALDLRHLTVEQARKVLAILAE